MKRGMNKFGQIWVETVIYTLIALTMIGAVLAFVIPRIEEIQDRSVIEQSINAVKDINNVILSVVHGGTGNKRLVETNIRKGKLKIDGVNDKIIFEMETNYVYSEPGQTVSIGNMEAMTEDIGGTNTVTLTSTYDYDITNNGANDERTIEDSTTPYTISIENKGENAEGKIIIDIVVS
ncbi:hypothetical protein HYT25_02370 [Candidatus Pacearchaeota archaeon]|nr:hypothetical protein [Candidatus Pacearchaeota archaeon]